jgi:hypothetical protein
MSLQGTSELNPGRLDDTVLGGHPGWACDSLNWFLAEHRECRFLEDLLAAKFGSGRGRPSNQHE